MTSRELDEILHHHWPMVIRAAMAGSDDWLKGFTQSIAKHGKRASWRPTAKQEQIMRRLVSELRSEPACIGSLIEG